MILTGKFKYALLVGDPGTPPYHLFVLSDEVRTAPMHLIMNRRELVQRRYGGDIPYICHPTICLRLCWLDIIHHDN